MAEDARELTVAVSPGSTGLDPDQPGSNGEFHRHCYSRLLAYPMVSGPNGATVGAPPQLDGMLASGWEASSDGKRYRIELCRGVMSSFGNELTADDVKWSWDRAFALRDVGKWVALIGSVPNSEAVQVKDRYVVEFRLSAGNPTFLQQLTRATPSIHDSAEAVQHATQADPWAKTWLSRSSCGFGAYSLDRLEPWKEAVFQANPDSNLPPKIPRIRYQFVAGSQRRLDLLRLGVVDLLPSVTPAEAMKLLDAPDVRVVRSQLGAHVSLIPNCHIPPFDRREVRRAIAYAIPYERILQEAYAGFGLVWRSMLPMTTPLALSADWPYDYDPERAKKMLADSGMGSGFATELFVDSSDVSQMASARIIAEALEAIGIRVALEPLEPGIFWQGGRYFRPYPLVIWDGHDQVPDAYYGLVHDYGPGRMGLTNCGQYASAEYFELLDRIEREPREVERATLIAEAQRVLVDDCPVVPLVQPDDIVAHRTSLAGFAVAPDGFFAAERLSWK